MNEDATSQDRTIAFNRAYGLYWIELVQLKVDTVYVERYRDRLTTRLSGFAIGRAIVSVGALGSWFAGIGHPEVWAIIIVASQVAEAVVNALPLSTRQKNLSAFALALNAILIDALMEWEDIYAGEIAARAITRRRHTNGRNHDQQTNSDGCQARHSGHSRRERTAAHDACDPAAAATS